MLCEVKTQSAPTQAIIGQCGFQFFDVIPTSGFSCGLWLMWKPCNTHPFNLVVLFKSSRFILCSVQLLSLNFSYVLIFIYAPARKEFKAEFWLQLINYINSLTLPFIILYSEISCIDDKKRRGCCFLY